MTPVGCSTEYTSIDWGQRVIIFSHTRADSSELCTSASSIDSKATQYNQKFWHNQYNSIMFLHGQSFWQCPYINPFCVIKCLCYCIYLLSGTILGSCSEFVRDFAGRSTIYVPYTPNTAPFIPTPYIQVNCCLIHKHSLVTIELWRIIVYCILSEPIRKWKRIARHDGTAHIVWNQT